MQDSKIMVSPELEGLIPELEDQLSLGDDFVTASLSLTGATSMLDLRLKGFTTSPVINIESTIAIKTALELLKNKTNVTVERFQINYQGLSMMVQGPFLLGNMSLKDINYPTGDCILVIDLLPQGDKKVIF